MLSSTERQHKCVTSFTRPATLQPTHYFQAKINELRGALAEGRGDADAGTHSDGVSFGGKAERCFSCSSSALTCGCFRFFHSSQLQHLLPLILQVWKEKSSAWKCSFKSVSLPPSHVLAHAPPRSTLTSHIQSLRHAAAAKSSKLEVGGPTAATASRFELFGRVLRRLNQQLLLPRCVKAWASVAASAAAAWDEKEVGGSRGAAERLVPSPVNMLTTQNPSQKSHLAPAQSLRSSLVKGQVTDSHAGWFSGGSVSPPTEAAGAIPRASACLPSCCLRPCLPLQCSL